MMQDPPRRGQLHIPHWILQLLHLAATALALLVVLALALEQRYGFLQHSPGGEAFDVDAQPWFMILFALGALIALRWQLVGGIVATFTAATLIVFADRQFELASALFVFFAFMVPALLWVVVGLFELRDEQFHRSPTEHPRPLLRRRDVVGGIGLFALAAVGGVRVGQWLFDRLYGPTHPSSRAVAVDDSLTRWVWTGAVTTTGATVTAMFATDDPGRVRLLVSETASLGDARELAATALGDGIVRVDIDDLRPGTRYHYAFATDTLVDRRREGTFTTFSAEPTTFDLVIGSCSRTGSNAAVFDTIRSLNPAMMIVDGDLHYADIIRNDFDAYIDVIDHTLRQPGRAALHQSCAVAYVWDDHDFGSNDADTPARPAAMAAYRALVPHYPLASDDSALYQAFNIGRVRVLLTDARAARQADLDDDDDDVGDEEEEGEERTVPTMLGDEQKQWLLDELLAARDSHQLTIWVNPVPWIAPIEEPVQTDGWGGFVVERMEIADFIADNDIARSLLMASGDAHMLAIDDGTNSDYSQAGGAAFPVFHAGALDRQGSIKGGPYSHGAIPGGGQFGLISVNDDGSRVTVHLSGRNWRNEELIGHTFTISPGTNRV